METAFCGGGSLTWRGVLKNVGVDLLTLICHVEMWLEVEWMSKRYLRA